MFREKVDKNKGILLLQGCRVGWTSRLLFGAEATASLLIYLFIEKNKHDEPQTRQSGTHGRNSASYSTQQTSILPSQLSTSPRLNMYSQLTHGPINYRTLEGAWIEHAPPRLTSGDHQRLRCAVHSPSRLSLRSRPRSARPSPRTWRSPSGIPARRRRQRRGGTQRQCNTSSWVWRNRHVSVSTDVQHYHGITVVVPIVVVAVVVAVAAVVITLVVAVAAVTVAVAVGTVGVTLLA